MCSLLSLPDKAMAWSSLNLRSSLNGGNWDATNDAPFTMNGDANKWKKEIDVSSLNDDIYFRIYVSDGERQIYPTSDPTEISVGSSTSALNFDANSTNNSWKISNPSSKYSKITIYAEYSNVWTIKVEGTPIGGGGATYKLMKKDNNANNVAGTGVATFTGSGFPYTATYNITQAGTYYFYVNDGTKDYLHEGQTFSNGKDVTIYQYGSTDNHYDHAVKLEATTTGTYTFTFSYVSGNEYKLKCVYPPSTSSDAYYLPNSGNNNFAINDNCKFVDGTLTLNLTAGFKFKVCKKTGSSETWYGDGSTISATTTDKSITLNTNDMTLTVTQPGTYTFKVEEISNGVKLSVTYPTSTHTVNVTAGEGGTVTPNGDQTVGTEAVSITATAKGGYVFEKWTASSTGIKIADAYSASTTFTATASGTVTANFTATSSDPIYYVVFPDANVGNTARADKTVTNKIPAEHTAFRLIPSRNRNDDTLDEDLVSINLKIDGDKGRQLRYDTNGEIKFYITDGSGNYFKTDALTSANDNLQATGKTANNGVDCYDTRSGSVSSGQPGHYYTIHQSDANDAKSLTFMFSKNNSDKKGYIINKGDEHPTTYKQPSNSVDGFGTDAGMKSGNLIVGFLTSRGYNSAYYTNHISHGVYLVGQMDGKKYTFDKNYKMKQILYPLGTTEAAADSIVYSCTVKKGSANWNDFFLSFSTGDKIDDGKLWNLLLRPSVQNQMDGQALEGGVTFFKDNDGEDNTQQALNPLLSNEQKQRYVSYTIYFNATYSTYRIEFHDGFYIAGPAVDESGSYAPANRIAMSKADLNGVEHYIYTGKFIQGQPFAFFLNEDSYTLNYCEDKQTVSAPSTSATAWDVQAPANGADYAFYNRVLYNTTGDNTNHTLGDGKSGMTWGLPTGTYTIRFYNHAEKENGQLYTVDKEVLMANVTSTFKESEFTSEKVHNYGGWRTLSDDCALLLPNGVKAYYAAQVQSGKVYLKELTDGYIPAHCPVILSNPNLLAGTKNIAFPVRPDGYDIQQTLADGEQNYLVDCYEKAGTVSPEVTVNGTPKYNYFFSYRFKFAGKEMSDVPLGFWKPFAGTATKKNYSYLSVDKQLYPSEYENYNFTYNEGETVVSTKAYCFVMAFDEDELGDNTTTGIEQVKDNAEVDMTNAVWHNMQGVRITKPSAPGMYICNGKKVVVR